MKKSFVFYALSFVLFAISSAIFLTILFKPLFSWFLQGIDTQYLLGLSHQQVSANYDQLLYYLLNPFQRDLVMANIPVSASGAFHFAQVKDLFLLNNGIFLLTFVTSWWSLKRVTRAFLWQPLARLGQVLSLALPALGLVLVSGFDYFFILFHEVTFGNNDWLFDPRTDPIILVLPENFFMACFIMIALLVELWFVFMALYSRYEIKLSVLQKD